MKVIIIALLAALSASKIKPEGKTIEEIIYKQSRNETDPSKEAKKMETDRKNKAQKTTVVRQRQQDNK